MFTRLILIPVVVFFFGIVPQNSRAKVVKYFQMDYGAACDGSTDDADVLKQVLDDAAACTDPDGFELRLPVGATIKLNTIYGTNQLFSLSGLENFYLKGNNAKFLIGTGGNGSLTGKGLFDISDAKNCTFSSFFVDYEEAPWSQGDILSIDTINQTITVTNDAGYMAANDDRITGKNNNWMTLHDDNGLVAWAGVMRFTSETELGNGSIELKYEPNNGAWPIDPLKCTRYVRVWRSGGHVFHFTGAENVIVDKVRIYASPCMAIIFNASKSGNQVVNCVVKTTPNSDRMISTTADGIHFNSGAEEGPLIENNTLISLEDDAIVVHCSGAYIFEASGNLINIQRSNRRVDWEIGDRVGLYNFNNDTSFTTAQITSITSGQYSSNHTDYPNEKYWQLRINDDIPAGFHIEPVSSYYDPDKTLTVAYDMNKRNNDTIIRDNFIKYNRARGIFADGYGFTIESNIISYTTQPAVWLGSLQRYKGPYDLLSFIIQNVRITGNTFNYNQNYGGDTSGTIDMKGAIFISNWDQLAKKPAQNSDFNHNINIVSNTVNGCGYPAIKVNSANRVKTSYNLFNDINKLKTGKEETYAIEHMNCTGVGGINVNNSITNCTVTQEVKAW